MPGTDATPAKSAFRLVRPTIKRSVATTAAAAPKRRFSSNWREPSSTMPGVTTTSRPGRLDPTGSPTPADPASAARASDAPAGLEL